MDEPCLTTGLPAALRGPPPSGVHSHPNGRAAESVRLGHAPPCCPPSSSRYVPEKTSPQPCSHGVADGQGGTHPPEPLPVSPPISCASLRLCSEGPQLPSSSLGGRRTRLQKVPWDSPAGHFLQQRSRPSGWYSSRPQPGSPPGRGTFEQKRRWGSSEKPLLETEPHTPSGGTGGSTQGTAPALSRGSALLG